MSPLILIVDDLAIVRDPIAACLESAGYRTACAGNGQEALQMLEKERPDLLLLDVSMPVMNGLELLAAIRPQARYARLPVILLTAADDRARVVDAARLGGQDFVLKTSFSVDGLLARVAKHAPPSPKAA